MSAKPTENTLPQQVQKLEKENARLNKTNQELNRSISRFKSFLESVDDSILICDREAKPVIWNLAYENLAKDVFGVKIKSGLPLPKYLPGENEIDSQNIVHERVLCGEQYKTEYTLGSSENEVSAENNARYLGITYSPIYENNHIIGFSMRARDITKQKLTEENLSIFKQALDASTDAIGMSTAQGNHYYQNASFDDLFGESGNDPPSTIYADEKIGREVFSAITGGIPWIGEAEMYRKDGKILNIFLRAYPVKDDNGKVQRVVGVHTNITNQKQAENELQKHREHLQDLVKERTRDLQESEDALRQSGKKSSELSRYLQRAVEDERKRIAREIHDDLGQTLIAMKMNLVRCREKLPDNLDPLVETAVNMEKTIDQMIQSIKTMISDLRAGPLADLGLEPAIEWLANSFLKDTERNIKIELTTESIDIDPNRSMALFRIAQEALTNIVRHADATAVTINLFVKNDQAVLRISDNGSGIPDATALPNSSYGIMGMKERARFFKGELVIESNKEGGGTTITASLPIKD